jgi:MFS family permease
MTMEVVSTAGPKQTSWLPMIIIAMAQVLMSFNVNALPVLIGGIVASFETPPTTVGTAIVTYSLFVAGFVMLGAKIGARLGSRRVFQATVGLFSAAMALMTFSSSAGMMILAQAVAGAAAAALVPTLVVLIAANYQGRQQAQALGWLGASEAMGGVLAFLVAGSLGTWLGWRYPFGLLVVLAGCVLILSRQLQPLERQPDVKIDGIGMVLAALAIILISVGFNSINSWGLLLASHAAPFDLLGLSPAPIMIAVGIVLGQAFFAWSKSRQAAQKTPLIGLGAVETPQQRSAVYLMFIIVVLGSAISFLIPLYMQIVQGRSSLQTALAIMPYSLSIFAAAILVLRLYDRLTGRQIARCAFLLMAAGLSLLAVVIRNEWETFMVILGLIVIGTGLGALVSVLFNALAAASPKELAGDVGSLRGTTNNLAGAVGTAIAGALLIGVLSATITTKLVDNPMIPKELKAQVDLDNVTFLSNDRLMEVLEGTTARPDQVAEAIRINTQARLRSLKVCFLALTGLALLAIFPAAGLSGGSANRPMRLKENSS